MGSTRKKLGYPAYLCESSTLEFTYGIDRALRFTYKRKQGSEGQSMKAINVGSPKTESWAHELTIEERWTLGS